MKYLILYLMVALAACTLQVVTGDNNEVEDSKAPTPTVHPPDPLLFR
jgi:hypothetical protein